MDLDDNGRFHINWKWIAQMLGSAVLGAVVLGGWIHKVDAHVGQPDIHMEQEERRIFVMEVFKDSIEPTLTAEHKAIILAIENLQAEVHSGRQ